MSTTHPELVSTVNMKRLFDFTAAAMALFLLWPVLLLLMVLVRLRMGSPVFFCQTRPGLHGRPFRLLKLRTMTDAKDPEGVLLPDPERLTPLGRFMRTTSLDELPQLWNVLKGDMSLVGPRPLFMKYLPWYTERERLRHTVRPGITGLAQVNGRNHLGWDARLELDVRYVETRSFLLDCRIMAKTVANVIKRKDVAVTADRILRDLDEERSIREVGATLH